MDFAAATAFVTEFLTARGFRCALVGGVGLAAYGLARTTLDLDFATDLVAQAQLVAHLESAGYETLYLSRGFSNHLHANPLKGRLDFVYVEGQTAERLFQASRLLPGPGGRKIRVAAPEHLAAMKVSALQGDPDREFQDLADLRFLLRLPDIDRQEVRQYCARHGFLERYERLIADL